MDVVEVHQRVMVARARVLAHLEETIREREALMARGARTPSRRLQAYLARRAIQLRRQERHWARWVLLLDRLLALLGQYLYAREMRDTPTLRTLRAVDWDTILRSVEAARAARADADASFSALLDAMGVPALPNRAPPQPPAAVEVALVKSVPDGDGLVLADGRKVRYIGIDAPEIWNRWRGSTDAFAHEAKALNERLVKGKRVRLVRDIVDRDKYGRLLRYVYVGDVFVNAELVRQGLARAFRVPPNDTHATLFEQLEQEARRKKRGMWKTGTGPR